MEAKALKDKYELKELELNSLLEITQAINNNLPEASLYKIYHFTLRASLNIKRLALYVLDEQWSCKVNFGTLRNFNEISLDDRFFKIKDITTINTSDPDFVFNEFDIIIPVTHKKNTLAFVLVGELRNDHLGPEIDANTTFIQALSNIILVAIENKKLARRQLRQEALRKELEIAKQVQQLLFPKNLPHEPDLTVEASYLPHHSVGGDYYDYVPINEDKFLLCIADVSGKGVPAAILMSNFQATLRTLARKTTQLKEIVKDLNFQILQNASGENFITFFLAIFDRKTDTLHYINAGHNPPILIDEKHGLRMLEKGTTILGVFKDLPFINEGIIPDLGSFFFFSYTDGLPETFNAAEEPFGIERLKEYLLGAQHKALKVIHEEILTLLNDFKGPNIYGDDITFLSCKLLKK